MDYSVKGLDVRGKLVVVTAKGNINWDHYLRFQETVRDLLPQDELGYTKLIFVAEECTLDAYSDEELASMGLQRIPKFHVPPSDVIEAQMKLLSGSYAAFQDLCAYYRVTTAQLREEDPNLFTTIEGEISLTTPCNCVEVLSTIWRIACTS